MYPYQAQRIQGLSVADYGPRLQFCQWVVNRIDENPNFCENILFTDEAGFEMEFSTITIFINGL